MPFLKGNKLGRGNKGRKRTPIWVERQKKARLGKHYSPKTQFKKGHIPYSKLNGNPIARNNPQIFKKGTRPYNWKGGISPFRMQIRSCLTYRIWRSDVFTRDNFTCIKCLKRGGILNADHYPKLFSTILNEYKIKTMEDALECEELWNINNGRTLCKACHYKITWNKNEQDN